MRWNPELTTFRPSVLSNRLDTDDASLLSSAPNNTSSGPLHSGTIARASTPPSLSTASCTCQAAHTLDQLSFPDARRCLHNSTERDLEARLQSRDHRSQPTPHPRTRPIFFRYDQTSSLDTVGISTASRMAEKAKDIVHIK